ncbi:CcdB family protein [Azospirillum doebereinerae]|uniref:CcdB family protein n=1 Tax=Azospirillum doebereinerae TaxID=92933 RepID=UPI001EE624CB|nr:CcdB family protein [Azospirillum doebereinerae]MCG5238196.1 CcdB family protein [Azospirillum doebereinerae]
MRFLDVCRNPAADGKPTHPIPYLLVVQGNYVAVSTSRIVVPLVRPSDAGTPIRDIMPTVVVGGERFIAVTPQMGSVPVTRIGPVISSALEAQSEIRRAIDVLTGDF